MRGRGRGSLGCCPLSSLRVAAYQGPSRSRSSIFCPCARASCSRRVAYHVERPGVALGAGPQHNHSVEYPIAGRQCERRARRWRLSAAPAWPRSYRSAAAGLLGAGSAARLFGAAAGRLCGASTANHTAGIPPAILHAERKLRSPGDRNCWRRACVAGVRGQRERRGERAPAHATEAQAA